MTTRVVMMMIVQVAVVKRVVVEVGGFVVKLGNV